MTGRFTILAMGAAGVLAAGAAVPAGAAVTLLDFEGAACAETDGAPATKACEATDLIGADYGSSALLTVHYDTSESSGARTSLAYTNGSYNHPNDSPKARPFSSGPADELSMIYFTPAAGYEVSFLSFEHVKLSATTSIDFIFKVFDPLGAEIFSGGINDSHSPNTAYYASTIGFGFGNGGRGSVAVDNIRVNVRALGAAAVPEPASWALMIAGFAMAGGCIRLRRRPNPLRALA